MANTLTDIQYKILARALLAPRKRTVLPNLVNTDYSADAAKFGASVNIEVAARATATDVTPSSTPLSPSNKTVTTVALPLDKWKQSDFHMTDKDMSEVSANDQFVPPRAVAAMDALIEQINSDIFATCYPGVYGWSGTAGTVPFNTANDPTPIPETFGVLNRQMCPRTDRRVVLDFAAESKALGNEAFRSADKAGKTSVILEGNLGRFYGMDFYSDDQVPRHTAGTITTGLIAKAATAVAAGLKTLVGTTAASTGAIALKAGDVIAIAGHTTTYVLTADATEASANTDEAIFFEPGLEAALVGSEAITVKASHRVNLAFNRDAIGFASRPLQDVGAQAVWMQDPQTGIPIRLETVRQHKQTVWIFDCLYGSLLARPEYACRVAGA